MPLLKKAKVDINGYKPNVVIGTKKLDNAIEIHLNDKGGSIPTEFMKKIFQPFFTTKPTVEGRGLGLCLSYNLITNGHGGELKVNTKVGVGTEFLIVLPE